VARGRELFYIAPDGRLTAVPLVNSADGARIDPGAPIPLFATQVGGAVQGVMGARYLVAPAGDRFVVDTVVDEPAPPISLIVNWRSKSGR
jgi:hypothetical protein